MRKSWYVWNISTDLKIKDGRQERCQTAIIWSCVGRSSCYGSSANKIICITGNQKWVWPEIVIDYSYGSEIWIIDGWIGGNSKPALISMLALASCIHVDKILTCAKTRKQVLSAALNQSMLTHVDVSWTCREPLDSCTSSFDSFSKVICDVDHQANQWSWGKTHYLKCCLKVLPLIP